MYKFLNKIKRKNIKIKKGNKNLINEILLSNKTKNSC
jgi:hypothetical protein